MFAALELIVTNGGRVAVIWLLLVLLAAAALAALALPRGVRRPRQVSAWLADSARARQAAEERKSAEAQDALTHRNGWDAALHPVEQELALARAAAAHRFAAYRAAVDAEQEAWRASDIAAAAVRSLRREVTFAAGQADIARSALEANLRYGGRRDWVAATVFSGGC